MTKKVRYKNNKVERRFTKEWVNNSVIPIDYLPRLVSSALEQRKNMVKYIEALHDELDRILDVVKTCESCPGILLRKDIRINQ